MRIGLTCNERAIERQKKHEHEAYNHLLENCIKYSRLVSIKYVHASERAFDVCVCVCAYLNRAALFSIIPRRNLHIHECIESSYAFNMHVIFSCIELHYFLVVDVVLCSRCSARSRNCSMPPLNLIISSCWWRDESSFSSHCTFFFIRTMPIINTFLISSVAHETCTHLTHSNKYPVA